ncbi:protein ARABIDILLO 1 [Hordeum vulgare]|nr:protein ARABIDILLO 1 [Hordeum vulgare]
MPRYAPHLCSLRLAVAPLLRTAGLSSLRLSGCRDLTDAALAVLAVRHGALAELHISPDLLDQISSDALRSVALCCPRLRCLRLSSLAELHISPDPLDRRLFGFFCLHNCTYPLF